MPSVELFDGITDPDDHLDVYKAQMYVQNLEDVMCCRYFLTTLKGIAQKWFNSLPSGSVTSFFPLAELFNALYCQQEIEKDQHRLAQNSATVGGGFEGIRACFFRW